MAGVGLLDDDPAKQGRVLSKVRVLGPIGELSRWCAKYGVRKVIIALPAARHVVRRRVAELCASAGIEALTVPAYEDLINGRLDLTTIRNVELDDLLGRDPIVLDSAGLGEWLGNRVVMITGAGGSIGAELARQIARFRPARLVLFDLSEAALYEICTILGDAFPQLPLAAVVGDVEARLARRGRARPREAVGRLPCGCVQARAADGGDERVAGRAQQRLRHVRARARVGRGEGREIRARLDGQGGQSDQRDGRDEAPRGDGLPVPARRGHAVRAGALRQRVRQRRQRDPALSRADLRGGPVTVTHPDITRYFMSLSEATQLLLQAGLQGRGGEILVLDMGEPVRIVDLARDMIKLSGADPSRIAVVFTGLRPGEKLYEEPLAVEEATKPTPHPKLRIAQAREADAFAVGQMVTWCESDRAADDAEVRARLKAWIPEYVPAAGAPVMPIPMVARDEANVRKLRRRAKLTARGEMPIRPIQERGHRPEFLARRTHHEVVREVLGRRTSRASRVP